jgi:hypothetical protein
VGASDADLTQTTSNMSALKGLDSRRRARGGVGVAGSGATQDRAFLPVSSAVECMIMCTRLVIPTHLFKCQVLSIILI